jgi:hypothetical protein
MGDFDLANRPTGKCRTCEAPIIWTLTQKNHRHPLNPEPVEGGNVIVTGRILAGRDRDTPTILVLKGHEMHAVESGRLRYVSHFATCPDSSSHRKDRRRA